MTQPKVTNKEPTRTPIVWLDKLFAWAKNRNFSTEATRKEFRYPEDERPEVNKEG
jgi:hypothetical protein